MNMLISALTTMVLPLPRTILSMNRRSMLLAATDSNHGATLQTVKPYSPEFPADADVSTPRLMAWKEPMAITSLKYSDAKRLPMEMEITSTPSAMASSNPARMSASLQHTL